MNQKLSNKIKVFNFIFTNCIVVYHWKSFNQLFAIQQNLLTNGLFIFYDALGYISLGFFFMASGYLLYHGIDERQDLLKKLKKRVYSLIIPFLIWNALTLIFQVLCSFYTGQLNISASYLLLGFSFVPFDGPLWYMTALVLLMCLSPLIMKFKQHPIFFGTLVAISFICAFMCTFYVNNRSNAIAWILRIVYYLPAYLLGSFWGLCKSNVIADEAYPPMLFSIICSLLNIAIICYLLFTHQISNTIYWILLHILPITIWLSFPNQLFSNMEITFPLQTTFFVYAMHDPIIVVTNAILKRILGYNSLHYAVSICLNLALVAILYVLCMLFAYVAKKLLPSKIFTALSGGRST